MFTLPEETKILISFLITQGVKSIANQFDKDISGKWSMVLAVGVFSFIHFIEGVLNIVPPEYQDAFLAGMGFLSSVLGMFGIHRTAKYFD